MVDDGRDDGLPPAPLCTCGAVDVGNARRTHAGDCPMFRLVLQGSVSDPNVFKAVLAVGVGVVLSAGSPSTLVGCDVRWENGHWVCAEEGFPETHAPASASRTEAVLLHLRSRLIDLDYAGQEPPRDPRISDSNVLPADGVVTIDEQVAVKGLSRIEQTQIKSQMLARAQRTIDAIKWLSSNENYEQHRGAYSGPVIPRGSDVEVVEPPATSIVRDDKRKPSRRCRAVVKITPPGSRVRVVVAGPSQEDPVQRTMLIIEAPTSMGPVVEMTDISQIVDPSKAEDLADVLELLQRRLARRLQAT